MRNAMISAVSLNMKIIYVCTGNICRSPLAEAVTRHHIERLKLTGRLSTGSAGTHGYHIGAAPDHRSIQVAASRKISMAGQAARKITVQDFYVPDTLILAMDRGHLEFLRELAPADATADFDLFMAYATGRDEDVPDPYYGSLNDFEDVYTQVNEGVSAILNRYKSLV